MNPEDGCFDTEEVDRKIEQGLPNSTTCLKGITNHWNLLSPQKVSQDWDHAVKWEGNFREADLTNRAQGRQNKDLSALLLLAYSVSRGFGGISFGHIHHHRAEAIIQNMNKQIIECPGPGDHGQVPSFKGEHRSKWNHPENFFFLFLSNPPSAI